MRALAKLKRTLLPIYQHHARNLHELNYIFFELTNRCNLACLHCGSDCVKQSQTPDLPARTVLEVLREVREHRDPHTTTIALSGGEPLLYPEVFELGAAIASLEFPWGMVTNGYAWTAERAREAEKAKMRSVTVSIDGLASSHDWLRGRAGSHSKATEAVALLREARSLQSLDVITCVHQRNLTELDAIADQLVRLGVTDWRLFTISPIGRARARPELALSAAQYHQLLDTIRRLRERSDIAVLLSESGYLGRHHELAVRDSYYFCQAGISVAGVMVNGDILACPNIDRRFKQGNVHTDSFWVVWEHKYQPFRDRSWMRVGRCRECSEWRHCQGNSFHLWDLDENRPKQCHYADFELERSQSAPRSPT